MKKTLIALLLLVGCTDDAGTLRAAKAVGLRHVRVGGYAWFGCGQHDNFATQFSATTADGSRVTGVVCCGVWKNCTVRF